MNSALKKLPQCIYFPNHELSNFLLGHLKKITFSLNPNLQYLLINWFHYMKSSNNLLIDFISIETLYNVVRSIGKCEL